MKYVIETLEIEIARLKTAIREYYSQSWSYEDTRAGALADNRGMERQIRQLEKGIEVLKEWQEANIDDIPPDWQ